MTAYAYFPGCSAHGTAKEYDQSTQSVCAKLGIELEEIPNWVCCGASPAHAVNHLLSLALVAKNLDLSPSDTIVTGCAACFNRFKTAIHALQHDRPLWEQVKQIVQPTKLNGRDFRVLHLLEVIHKFGLEGVKERVTKPLKGLKVACYYGCLLVRPPKVMAFDDPDNPKKMDELIAAVGAEPVEWEFKTECCGAFHAVPHPEIVLRLTSNILRAAKDAGADLVSVACPMCQINLDLRQLDIQKRHKVTFNMPVLYFTQLLGLALGINEGELGFDRLIIDPRPILREKGLV